MQKELIKLFRNKKATTRALEKGEEKERLKKWVFRRLLKTTMLRHQLASRPLFRSVQWCRLHRAWGHVPPLFYKRLGTRRGAPWVDKLTKLCWLLRKHSPKQLIVLLEPKSGRAWPKNVLRRFVLDRCPHFQIRSGAACSIHTQITSHRLVQEACTLFTKYFTK